MKKLVVLLFLALAVPSWGLGIRSLIITENTAAALMFEYRGTRDLRLAVKGVRLLPWNVYLKKLRGKYMILAEKKYGTDFEIVAHHVRR
jgi:hypothetical protein